MADRRIILRARYGELPYIVIIEPESGGCDLSGRFADHRAAFGYAAGLRMTHGWPIIDETEVGNGH